MVVQGVAYDPVKTTFIGEKVRIDLKKRYANKASKKVCHGMPACAAWRYLCRDDDKCKGRQRAAGWNNCLCSRLCSRVSF